MSTDRRRRRLPFRRHNKQLTSAVSLLLESGFCGPLEDRLARTNCAHASCRPHSLKQITSRAGNTRRGSRPTRVSHRYHVEGHKKSITNGSERKKTPDSQPMRPRNPELAVIASSGHASLMSCNTQVGRISAPILGHSGNREHVVHWPQMDSANGFR